MKIIGALKRSQNRAPKFSGLVTAAVAILGFGAVANGATLGLTINATFDPTLTSAEQAQINIAIANVEAAVTSPHNIAVSIYFNSTNSGLGESITSVDTPAYYDFYNDLVSVATQSNQLTAIASLGTAPTSMTSSSPVPGATSTKMYITTAEARNLGFSGFGTTPGVPVNSVNYDGQVLLNTTMTSAPGTLNGSTYSLQSVAAHEIDEILGIGGTGTALGTGNQGQTGALDLFRYSASGTRSYTTSTSATSYFSIDAGRTILSYFNQSGSGDYSDWNNTGHSGFAMQVQDAFGTPGVDVVLGTTEITALNVIGYRLVNGSQVTAPEPSTTVLCGLSLVGLGLVGRKRSWNR